MSFSLSISIKMLRSKSVRSTRGSDLQKLQRERKERRVERRVRERGVLLVTEAISMARRPEEREKDSGRERKREIKRERRKERERGELLS